MTAADLTAAARRIRHDVTIGQAHGDDAFLLAVADQLENSADMLDGLAQSGSPALVAPGCFGVARAYLATP